MHSPNRFLCRKVVSRCSRDAVGTGRSYTVTGGRCSPVQEWYPNSDTECVFCNQLGQNMLVVSERKKKLKKVDVASASTAQGGFTTVN